jgi:hypothetical protein
MQDTKTVTVGAAGAPSAAEIQTAPNFSAADLTALPKDAWPTVGGNLHNERYSPLTQIDTSNASQLNGVWRRHLDGSGLAAKYSAEGQPVVYKGVIYITTGEDDVFAVSVATGKVLWKHVSGIAQRISTICCGWDNRGVAIGDSRVYVGQLDGKVVALDQQTGKQIWSRRLVHWQLGQTITAAPIYVDGKIYIGVVGAEYGTRSFLQALDATNGGPVWRWYTTASPGQPGGETWPSGSQAYLRDGGTIWQAPAVAGPPRHLGLRLREPRRALRRRRAQGDRTGIEDGLGVHARPRDGKAALRHHREARAAGCGAGDLADAAHPGERRVHAARDAARGRRHPRQERSHRAAEEGAGRHRAPRVHPAAARQAAHLRQRAAGRVNWQPISYNEKTQMIYVCSAVSWVGVEAANQPYPGPGKSYTGVAGTAGFGWPEGTGTFTAIDASSGKVV